MPDVFDSRKSKKKKKKTEVDAPTVFDTSVESDQAVKPPHSHVDTYSQVMSHEPEARNPLKAFAAKPTNTFFDSQANDEKVLLLLRQHPITQVKWIVIAIILIVLPFFLQFVPLLEFLPLRFHLVAAIGWYLMVIGFSLEAFLDWFFNVYIITDERVIDVDFSSLLFKNVSYAKIDRIEDVSFTTSGTLGAIFDYGTVVVQTAATLQEFEFEHVPYPSKVTTFINELINEEEREQLEGRVS
jgi:hypothetical protein